VRAHLLRLVSILSLTVAVYWIPTGYYFCGFDDIRELYRLHSTPNPGLAHDFATPVIGGGQKYRPLSWTANRLTWEAGRGSPRWFRIRNLICHLVAIICVYSISWFLFGSLNAAALAALLFSIHPYTHQGIMGAAWTVTPSVCTLLLGVAFFLYAMQSSKARTAWLVVSLVFGAAGFFFYDPMASYFGIILVYLGFSWWRGWLERPSVVQIFLILLGILAPVLTYATLRQTATAGAGSLTKMLANPPEIAINTLLYFLSPLIFLDPVLGHELLDLPLPSAILAGDRPLIWFLVVSGPLVFILANALLFRNRVIERFGNLDGYRLAFLVIAMGGVQAPFVLFSGHASETYMYPFMALMSVLLGYLLANFLHGRILVAAAITLTLLYIPALHVRSKRIATCANCVSNVAKLFQSHQISPVNEFLFSHVPGQPRSEVYGFYGFHGIDSVGIGIYGGSALQELKSYFIPRTGVSARVVSVEELRNNCYSTAERKCFYVYADGELEPYVKDGRIP